MKKIKRIGLLTSGGDAPGMNACIRAVVRTALTKGIDVMGIRRGYEGLINGDIKKMERISVSNIIHLGGTILGTSRCEEFKTKEGRKRAAENMHKYKMDALVVIGGDGSFRGAKEFSDETGIPVIGIPGSIDNDIYGTDYTIGFDTALNTALDAVDRIRDTATSHERIFYVEVMGRLSGFIALESAIAGGAETVIIPETKTNISDIAHLIEASYKKGKRSIIIIVAEGDESGNAFQIAQKVYERTKLEYRVCVLGHIQRGGRPTARDRILATKLGYYAVEGLLEGERNVMVGELKGEIAFTPLSEVISRKKVLDAKLSFLVELLGR
jgi:6-phosphofructokinase 1